MILITRFHVSHIVREILRRLKELTGIEKKYKQTDLSHPIIFAHPIDSSLEWFLLVLAYDLIITAYEHNPSRTGFEI